MMTFRMFILGLAAILAALPAFAQANCAPRELVVARLAAGYGEVRAGMGLAANGAVLEIFASADTGTWTITMTPPGGATCLLASGEGWERMDDALPPPGVEL